MKINEILVEKQFKDIPAWANRSGHELLELTEENNYIKFYLRKK